MDNSYPFPARVLICGLGSIGKRHLQVIRSNWPSLEIAVLRSGKGIAYELNPPVDHIFFHLSEALAWRPDVAIVSTPSTDHLSKALPLARHGVSLLIEKPVGSGYERETDWEELLELSKLIPICVGYVLRHDPCATVVKDNLINSKIGKVLEADFYCGSWLPEWRPGSDYRQCVSANKNQGGGVLLELSHEIDLAQWFLGPVTLNYSFLKNTGLLDTDCEDQALLVGSFSDDRPLTVRLNYCTKPAKRSLLIRGTMGEIKWNLLENKVCMYDAISQSSEVYLSPHSADDRYYLQFKYFLDFAMRRVPPMCSLTDSLNILKLIRQARQI